jgi:hypothetical protein
MLVKNVGNCTQYVGTDMVVSPEQGRRKSRRFLCSVKIPSIDLCVSHDSCRS